MEAKMKLFGHPIHPMLVAFPVAFNVASLAGYAIFGASYRVFWLRLAITMNVAAVGTALVAALPGFADWYFRIPRRTEARRTGVIHMMLNLSSLALFAGALAMYANDWNNDEISAVPGIVMTGAGVLCTIAAGFFGWKLVQDHHVGVHIAPEAERADQRLRRVS